MAFCAPLYITGLQSLFSAVLSSAKTLQDFKAHEVRLYKHTEGFRVCILILEDFTKLNRPLQFLRLS